MDPSPYYSTLGRGNESQLQARPRRRRPARPLAALLRQLLRPARVRGDPRRHGRHRQLDRLPDGPRRPDNLPAKVVIDWLNGRAPAYDKNGNPVVAAAGTTASPAMIGKSYDGTLANGVAATGVEGLTTIVPISAISSWYDYTRTNGVIAARQPLPAVPRQHRHRRRPARLLPPIRDALSADDGDATGDYNAVLGRAQLPSRTSTRSRPACSSRTACRTTTSARPVLQVVVRAGGQQRAAQAVAAAAGSRRPVRLRRAGLGRHAAPLVRLLAAGRPERDHERAARSTSRSPRTPGRRYADWPMPGTQIVRRLSCRATTGHARAARRRSGGATDTLTFTDANLQRERLTAPDRHDANNRRVFLSPALKTPLRDLRHADRRPARVAGQAAVEPLGDARRLRRQHADHAHRRRHLNARPRAERLLGRRPTRRRRPPCFNA